MLAIQAAALVGLAFFVSEGVNAADCDKNRAFNKAHPFPKSEKKADNFFEHMWNEWNALRSSGITAKDVGRGAVALFRLSANGWKNILTFKSPDGSFINSCGKYACHDE
jgi:hypothetical protein